MASTYSTNLALELIGTGDQSGTWGNTTNTNLGTLIEQAISGYVTQAITDGADTTITIPNGATGVARNMAIEMTGALTAARNLIVPANKKLYFIYNNTTGGFAVTVKVSGQTGVSVPNGKKMLLVSNGTDIVEAVNAHSTLAVAGAATFGSTTSHTGVASFADGTVGTPGLNFSSDTDSGIYRIGANNIGIGVNGAKVLDIGTTGLKVTIPTSGVTGVQIGTGSTTQMGWLVGNLNNGAAAMWVTSVTPSASNYTVYADGVGVGTNFAVQSYFKATSDGTLYNSAAYHESRQSAANWTHIISNKNASSPYGVEILYTAAAPNGTDNYFLLCADSGANRAYIPSNGGLYNYQANNSNLSDERLKKDWANAPSYYERWKQIEFKTFLYKDQTDTELNLGVSAQQLESVCPELVNKNGWGKEIPEDGVPLKSVYQTDFQFATAKALQELMLKFEELKAEFDAYKAAHP